MTDKPGKTQYRIRNWREYDTALRNRGSLTFWVDDEVLSGWLNAQKSGRRGASATYSNLAIATVTAQAGGQLTGVYFQEGQSVNKGDLLFEIDPRSLKSTVAQSAANQDKTQAQLAQAQAQLSQSKTQVQQAQATVTKDKAQANYVKTEVQRYQSLVTQGAVSQEQVGQYQANAIAQRATVSADQSAVGMAMAAVESARANLQSVQSALSAAASQVESDKLQLDYTDIHAPVSGRLGQFNVNEGNLIAANSATPLVTISQINPIYVQFSIPQSQLGEVKKYQAEGNLQVEASGAQRSGSSERGSLVFLDSSVNATTGTLLAKAAFPNEDGGLTPGEFVNVSLADHRYKCVSGANDGCAAGAKWLVCICD